MYLDGVELQVMLDIMAHVIQNARKIDRARQTQT